MKTPHYLAPKGIGLITRCSAATSDMKCMWVENGELSEMFDFFVWSVVGRYWGIFFLFADVLLRLLSVFFFFFFCSSLEAGGLASGQHAHNPHQNSSHLFILPVLQLSLASVCKYGNSARECHWWHIMKISLWRPKMGEKQALWIKAVIYAREISVC